MLKYYIIVITCCNATLLQEMQLVRNALLNTNASKPCSISVLDSEHGMDPFVCRALVH